MRRMSGFTLVEIAIVMVIIGLLLGGVLKGQELIQSARVHNLASMQDGIKAAFFGFQDRFRALPGDYTQAVANITGVSTAAACGTSGNGDGDGQISGAEAILAWDHLSHAGFITGTYTCVDATTVTAATTPTNVYGSFVQLIYDNVYGLAGAATRHNLKTGPSIPVSVITELDRKIDDGLPYTGTFLFSTYAGNGTAPVGGSATDCTSAATVAGVWNANNGVTNCGDATLF